MMTFTFTSIERFDRLVEALATDPASAAAEGSRIAAALTVAGIGVARSSDGGREDERHPLPDSLFDTLVRSISDAQSRPIRHERRIVLTLFGFGIVPRRVLETPAQVARR